jgi:hypothetical protein
MKYVYENNLEPVNVALYCQAAGCFWKNLDIVEYFAHVPTILQGTTTHSSRLLLPHIEPWLDSFFPQHTHDGPEVMRLSFFPEDESEIILSSHFDITWGSNRHHEIGIVESVSVPESFLSRPDLRSLAEVDIRQSPAEQWWLFLPLSCAAEPELEWILVNYEEQRMYVGPNATTALVWKGRDICDMGTWARLKTVEEIRDHGGN